MLHRACRPWSAGLRIARCRRSLLGAVGAAAVIAGVDGDGDDVAFDESFMNASWLLPSAGAVQDDDDGQLALVLSGERTRVGTRFDSAVTPFSPTRR